MPADHDNPEELFLGLDFGTSGCRGMLITANGHVHAQADCSYPEPDMDGRASRQDPTCWSEALYQVCNRLCHQTRISQVKAIAVDATSSSLLAISGHPPSSSSSGSSSGHTPFADTSGIPAEGRPVSAGIMYNDHSATAEAETVSRYAPADSPANGAGASLAKMLWLQRHYPRAGILLHQADWLTGLLCGDFTLSDTNNALKLGFDPVYQRWPDWLVRFWTEHLADKALPTVNPPGAHVGRLCNPRLLAMGFSPATEIHAATTDSTAAFLATGAGRTGDAVTSLGSTLVLKILGTTPVFAPEYGVYSHRLDDRWLVGGASNSGGNVLKHYFSISQIQALSTQIDPDRPTGLHYYPLAKPGERFPVNDPELTPNLSPRPDSDARFLQAMMEGIAEIELQGYQCLQRLGAPPLRRLFSVGGGSTNASWTRIRQAHLRNAFPGVEFTTPVSEHAAYGAALLALKRDTLKRDTQKFITGPRNGTPKNS